MKRLMHKMVVVAAFFFAIATIADAGPPAMTLSKAAALAEDALAAKSLPNDHFVRGVVLVEKPGRGSILPGRVYASRKARIAGRVTARAWRF